MSPPKIIHVPAIGELESTKFITDYLLSQIIGGTLIPNQGVAKALAREVRRLRDKEAHPLYVRNADGSIEKVPE